MKPEQIFVGIDVSKGYADIILLTSEKELFERSFQLDDTKEGHKILKSKLEDLATRANKVICGVENTGGYERNWVTAIKSLSNKNKKIEVYKLNPKAVKHQISSLMRRTIDDSISAEAIAIYMANNYQLVKQNWERSIKQTREITEGKLLHKMIQGLIKQRTMKLNQFEKLLYQTFPEMLEYSRNSQPKWVLKLLEKYPSAEAVKRAKIKGLTSIKGISESKAKDIKQKAINSVASFSGKITEIIISQHCKDIIELDKEIDKLKKVLVDLYKDNKDIKILTSAKGIGDWTATAFLIDLGDYLRFNSTDQLAAFYGVHPSFKQSGDGKFKVKMSKQGSASMRATLYLIAHNLYMHNQYFKSLYAKYAAKGKKHNAIMGILMHKALRVLWGMLKSRTEFNCKVDIENQEKNKQNKEVPILSIKARRLQKLTMKAPVSRSNIKKRRAMIESQSSTRDENTRSSIHSSVQT